MPDINTGSICLFCMNPLAPGVSRCSSCGRNANEPVPPEHLAPGTVLGGKYLVGRALGQGRFGITYAGYDIVLHTKLAIKEFFAPQLCRRDGSGTVLPYPGQAGEVYKKELDKFLSEAIAIAKLSSLTNIVHVRDTINAFGTAYVVMDFTDGRTLAAMQGEPPVRFPVKNVLELLYPLMGCLGKLHAQNIIHRDICPESILVNPIKGAVLVDFGAARDLSGEAAKTVSMQARDGYAPAELYATRGQGPWTDVYSLCASVYKLVTGVTPQSSVYRLTRDTLAAPSSLSADISPAQEAVLMKGMAPRPQDRYQDMPSLMAAFRAASAGGNQTAPQRTVPVQQPQQPQQPTGYQQTGYQQTGYQQTGYQQTGYQQTGYQQTGYQPVPQNTPPVQPSRPHVQKKKNKWLLPVVITGSAVAVLLILFFTVGQRLPFMRYIAAEKLFDNGSYQEAYEAFNELDDYRDSDDRADESLYRYARSLLDDGEYSKAKKQFDKLGSYSDSRDMVLECDYRAAVKLLDSGDYDGAKAAFYELGDYSDSANMLLECDYRHGCDAYDTGDYVTSVDAFSAVLNYLDAYDKANESRYQYVLQNADHYDDITWLYFDELLSAGYADSASIYEDFTEWHITVVSNNSEYDTVSSMDSISKYDKWYFHLIATGGERYESITVSYEAVTPNGKTSQGSGTLTMSHDENEWFRYYYTNPSSSSATGTMTVRIYNDDTNELLATHTVNITD